MTTALFILFGVLLIGCLYLFSQHGILKAQQRQVSTLDAQLKAVEVLLKVIFEIEQRFPSQYDLDALRGMLPREAEHIIQERNMILTPEQRYYVFPPKAKKQRRGKQ